MSNITHRCANLITVAYAQYFCYVPSILHIRYIHAGLRLISISAFGQIRFVDQIEQNPHFGQLVGTHEGMLLFF